MVQSQGLNKVQSKGSESRFSVKNPGSSRVQIQVMVRIRVKVQVGFRVKVQVGFRVKVQVGFRVKF